MIGKERTKPTVKRIVGGRCRKRFNTAKSKDMGMREEVIVTLTNNCNVLADVDDDDQDVNIRWQSCKRTFVDTCKEVLQYRETARKECVVT